MSFGNSDSFVHFLVAVEIFWWRYQFKSPPIADSFWKSQFHFVFLWMLFLLYFHNYHKNFMWICENSTNFLSPDVIWHVDYSSNPSANCLLTDILSNFNFSFLACSKISLFSTIVWMYFWRWIFSLVSVHFIVFILLGKFSSS